MSVATKPTTGNTATAMFDRLAQPESGSLAVEAARTSLAIQSGENDRKRMRELAVKARQEALTQEEDGELVCYQRAGNFLALLDPKARLSLAKTAQRR